MLRFPPVSGLLEHSSDFPLELYLSLAELPNHSQDFQRNNIKIYISFSQNMSFHPSLWAWKLENIFGVLESQVFALIAQLSTLNGYKVFG